MYPKSISEYMPTDSERLVYYELKTQLPDSFEVFYSVNWTAVRNGSIVKSEADFIVTSPEYGFLCLEVKGGNSLRIEDNSWYIEDSIHGERKLNMSPYDQAEKSMYYFFKTFSNKYNMSYQGIYAAAAIFPFYSVGTNEKISNRDRMCTIDCNDMNTLYDRIKKIFRFYRGDRFNWFYPKSQHDAFLELIRERIAISAAAGALVKYKEQQLDVINRVQDNYIYFIGNVRQFFVRGGAGTGKSWIAVKLANQEYTEGKKVLFICASKHLVEHMKAFLNDNVDAYDMISLFSKCVQDFERYQAPAFRGIGSCKLMDTYKYDAIFVDEAQDINEECATVIRRMLINKEDSRLGVFYDDVQILREDSFGNGFGIAQKPFMLRENIRNTANIYVWTSDKTNLGKDTVANPVEGPTPITEIIYEKGQMTNRLENLFRRYLVDEYLLNTSLTLIVENYSFLNEYADGVAQWRFVKRIPQNDKEIRIASIEDFKGLESDMVVYIHSKKTTDNMNYIAYTRAKYYLIEFLREY